MGSYEYGNNKIAVIEVGLSVKATLSKCVDIATLAQVEFIDLHKIRQCVKDVVLKYWRDFIPNNTSEDNVKTLSINALLSEIDGKHNFIKHLHAQPEFSHLHAIAFILNDLKVVEVFTKLKNSG